MKKFLVLGITTIVMVVALCLMFVSCTTAIPLNTNKVESKTTIDPETSLPLTYSRYLEVYNPTNNK